MKPRAKVRQSKRPTAQRRKPVKSSKRKAQVEARYEAASQTFFDRSWIPAAVQDARFDADSSTRLELVRRSRYWERNNAIVNRLADVFEQYTVGPSGLQVIPTCEGDDGEDWNQTAAQWWAGWSKWPDVSSGLPLGVLQSIMARTWFLYPVMNDLHDLDDLQFLEMKAAKSNADVANVVTNKTGEATVTASRRQRWQIQSQDKDGNPVNKQAPLFYETTLGGRTIYVSNGEKF